METMALAVNPQTALTGYAPQAVQAYVSAVRSIAPWANDPKYKVADNDVILVVQRALALGVDPLNPHEVQIWVDSRGKITFQLAYTIMAEWARLKGEHTEPRYTRLTAEEMRLEGLQSNDIAYRAAFIMRADLGDFYAAAQAIGLDEARAMFEVRGIGSATAAEYADQYFAPKGRPKSWKVQKRALIDAYRKRFGTPTKAEIEAIRRGKGWDKIEPEHWVQATQSAPNANEDGIVELAKAAATRDKLTAEIITGAAELLYPGGDVVDGEVVEAVVVEAPAPAEPEPQAQPVQEPEFASEPTASMSMAEARGYFAAAFNAAKKSGKTPKPINMEGLSVTEIIRAAHAL